MSLVEDARQGIYATISIEDYPDCSLQECRLCGEVNLHVDYCPAPRIMAALEAAERLIEAQAYPPAAYDQWQQLVAALGA